MDKPSDLSDDKAPDQLGSHWKWRGPRGRRRVLERSINLDIRSQLVVICCAMGSTGAVAEAPSPLGPPKLGYYIESAPLQYSLREWGTQTGAGTMVYWAVSADLSSNGWKNKVTALVAGRYTAVEALCHLLRGTGLSFVHRETREDQEPWSTSPQWMQTFRIDSENAGSDPPPPLTSVCTRSWSALDEKARASRRSLASPTRSVRIGRMAPRQHNTPCAL
jgi:hypothetical protein